MPHEPGAPPSTNTDFFERSATVRTWLAQLSGSLKSFRLPTGLLDFKLLDVIPALPPPGWARFSILNNVVRVLDSTGFNLLRAGGYGLLADPTLGVDLTSTGATGLLTVPVGEVAVVTRVEFSFQTVTTVTGDPRVGVGIAAGEDDIIKPQVLVGVAAGKVYAFNVDGIKIKGNEGEVVKLGVDVAAVATALTCDVRVFGYLESGGGSVLSGAGADTTAIHDNVAAEISAVAAKATPTAADFLLIEDAADSDSKKRITLGDLPGGSGADLTHHAYPWAIRQDRDADAPGSGSFLDLHSILHYPGWTITQDTTGAGSGVNQWSAGEEKDGTVSRRTTFFKFANVATEDVISDTFDLRIAVPNDFTQFGSGGIIVRHKISVNAGGAGAAGDTGVLRIDVFDPTTVGDTSVANASRTVTAAEVGDTDYQEVQIDGATLNAIPNAHQAGDFVHLRINLSGAFSSADLPSFWLGRLSAYFA